MSTSFCARNICKRWPPRISWQRSERQWRKRKAEMKSSTSLGGPTQKKMNLHVLKTMHLYIIQLTDKPCITCRNDNPDSACSVEEQAADLIMRAPAVSESWSCSLNSCIVDSLNLPQPNPTIAGVDELWQSPQLVLEVWACHSNRQWDQNRCPWDPWVTADPGRFSCQRLEGQMNAVPINTIRLHAETLNAFL